MNKVCHDCIGNIYLKEFINDQKSRDKCYYCGKNKHTVFLSDLIEEILNYLYLEYDHADDVLGYKSKKDNILVLRMILMI